MLSRIYDIAKKAAEPYGEDIATFITTDDKRIADHAEELGAACINTSPSCRTGSDRVLSAIRQLNDWPEFIINLQGDAPFTNPKTIQNMIEAYQENRFHEVITPVQNLSWVDLDRLRELKKKTPFSGTTAVIDNKKNALWFSKNIIPVIRKEDALRQSSPLSPVYQHIGLYGFRSDILERFCMLPEGQYESFEGLEQLRMLENGIRIHTIEIENKDGDIQSGIDSPEDLKRAEAHIRKHGEPHS